MIIAKEHSLADSNYSTRDEIDWVELELNLEKDLNISFETGFNQHGRALCWKEHPSFLYKTQCVIDLQGQIIFQSDSLLNKIQKAQYYLNHKQVPDKMLERMKSQVAYTDVQPFYNGYAIVQVIPAFGNLQNSERYNVSYGAKEYNYIDVNGKMHFQKGFLSATPYTGRFFAIQSVKDREFYYLKHNGKRLIHQQQWQAKPIINGYYIDKNLHLINELDQQLTNVATHLTFTDNHQLGFVEYGSLCYERKCYFINADGERYFKPEVSKQYNRSLAPKETSYTHFSNGIITKVIDGVGVKYINLEGNLLSKELFEIHGTNLFHDASKINHFSQGFAVVKTSEGFNYINQRGEYLLQKFVLSAFPFSYGLAITKTKDGAYIAIDRFGNPRFSIAVPHIYEVKISFGLIHITPEIDGKIQFKKMLVLKLNGDIISENVQGINNSIDLLEIYSEEGTLNWWGDNMLK